MEPDDPEPKKPDWEHVKWDLREEEPPESRGTEAASYAAMVLLAAMVFGVAAVIGPYVGAYIMGSRSSTLRSSSSSNGLRNTEWVAEWDGGRFMVIRGVGGAVVGAGLAAAAIYAARKK